VRPEGLGKHKKHHRFKNKCSYNVEVLHFKNFKLGAGSQDSSVGIVYRLWAERPENRGSIPCRCKKNISHSVRTDSGAYQASYSVVTGGFLRGGTAAMA
jgi:hypothetical protein